MSAWDVIRHEFEDEHIQAFLLWQAYQTLVPVDSDGSGQLAYSLVFGRQRRSWTIPRGGSGALTDALVRCIEEHGGKVLCGRRVVRLLVDGGRCTGVETEDGERFTASEAVVSTIHVKHLLEMADGLGRGLPLRRGDVRRRRVGDGGLHGGSGAAGVREPDGPRRRSRPGSRASRSDVIDYGRALRDGRYVEDPAWLLVATPTLVDPSRAPDGRHTVKFLCGAVVRLPGAQGGAGRPPARAAAAGRDLRLRHAAREGAGGHRGRQRAHDPRHVPRRQPHLPAERRAAAGAGLGLAPDADRGPLPDRRHDPPGRLDHGRTRAATRRWCCCRTSDTTSGRWCAVADARVQSAIGHWAPRFVQAGMDYSDFMRAGAGVERWEDWLDAFAALGDAHAHAPRRPSTRAASPPARRGCTPPSPTTSRSSSGWSTRPARREVADRAVAAIYAAHEHLDPSPSGSRRGSTAATIVGNLRVPWYDEDPPLVLLIPGLDSTKEEFCRLENVFLSRGMAVLSLDGPGQGEGGYTLPIRHDYEAGGDRDPRRAGRALRPGRRARASASAATTRRGRRRSSRGSRPSPASAARSTSARCGSRCRN